jgi:hypothetical protein
MDLSHEKFLLHIPEKIGWYQGLQAADAPRRQNSAFTTQARARTGCTEDELAILEGYCSNLMTEIL